MQLLKFVLRHETTVFINDLEICLAVCTNMALPHGGPMAVQLLIINII